MNLTLQPRLEPLQAVRPTSPKGTERRRATRYPVTLETAKHLIAQIEGDAWPARVRNISVSGISLILGRRVEPETVVNLELFNKDHHFYCKVPLRAIYILEHADGNFMLGGAFVRELTNEELRGLL